MASKSKRIVLDKKTYQKRQTACYDCDGLLGHYDLGRWLNNDDWHVRCFGCEAKRKQDEKKNEK